MENDSKEKNNIVKKINDLVTGNVLNNLVYASMITIYFMFFNMYAVFTETEIFIQYIKIASFIFLLFSIFIFEIAYKKDNDEISLNGIEFLVLSIFSLLIQYIPKLLKIDENTYMLAGTYIFLIYYGIKNIIIYTCERKKELDNLSDIKEIVKDEPIKKETKIIGKEDKYAISKYRFWKYNCSKQNRSNSKSRFGTNKKNGARC